jgi:hypothetical protein
MDPSNSDEKIFIDLLNQTGNFLRVLLIKDMVEVFEEITDVYKENINFAHLKIQVAD